MSGRGYETRCVRRDRSGKKTSMGEEDLDREESDDEEATVLPAREAMSIISQGSPSGEEDATREEGSGEDRI
jgi:hypothetical protein